MASHRRLRRKLAWASVSTPSALHRRIVLSASALSESGDGCGKVSGDACIDLRGDQLGRKLVEVGGIGLRPAKKALVAGLQVVKDGIEGVLDRKRRPVLGADRAACGVARLSGLERRHISAISLLISALRAALEAP